MNRRFTLFNPPSKSFFFPASFFFSCRLVTAASPAPRTGFVLHFDTLSSASEAVSLIRAAKNSGAGVINLVPPSHVWERALDLAALDRIVGEINRGNLQYVITRTDAAYLPDADGNRINSLYAKILSAPGRLPSGKPTADYFLSTVNVDGYAKWMEDETRFYAKRYGRDPRLLGIDIGPFSEPFVSQRSGFLQYDSETESYELTQYTPEAAAWWHSWLLKKFGSLAAINAEYGVKFSSVEEIPLPLNEEDKNFFRADRAYFDFVRSVGDWYFDGYARCRTIWHEEAGSAAAPFILQMSGYDAEKFILGRPGLWAFSWLQWIQQADAVGLSLYTNNEYPDFGHGSIKSMIDVIRSSAGEKKIFVLESGTEAPAPVFLKSQLKFESEQARRLSPQTYIYEFLKAPFYAKPVRNDGHLIDSDGKPRATVVNGMRRVFKIARENSPSEKKYPLAVLFDSSSVREHPRVGEIYSALLDISADLPIRWILSENEISAEKIPLWRPTAESQPRSLLDSLIETAPKPSSPRSPEFTRWLHDLRQKLIRP